MQFLSRVWEPKGHLQNKTQRTWATGGLVGQHLLWSWLRAQLPCATMKWAGYLSSLTIWAYQTMEMRWEEQEWSTPFWCISSDIFNRVEKGDAVTSFFISLILLGEGRVHEFREVILLACVICQLVIPQVVHLRTKWLHRHRFRWRQWMFILPLSLLPKSTYSTFSLKDETQTGWLTKQEGIDISSRFDTEGKAKEQLGRHWFILNVRQWEARVAIFLSYLCPVQETCQSQALSLHLD